MYVCIYAWVNQFPKSFISEAEQERFNIYKQSRQFTDWEEVVFFFHSRKKPPPKIPESYWPFKGKIQSWKWRIVQSFSNSCHEGLTDLYQRKFTTISRAWSTYITSPHHFFPEQKQQQQPQPCQITLTFIPSFPPALVCVHKNSDPCLWISLSA